MWRLYTDEKGIEEDWYIKPNQSVRSCICLQGTSVLMNQKQYPDRWPKHPETRDSGIADVGLPSDRRRAIQEVGLADLPIVQQALSGAHWWIRGHRRCSAITTEAD